MASPHHSPSSPSTSDVMTSLCTKKSKQNGEISANEKDNRNSQKHNSDNESRKRDEPEDKGEAERKNEFSNTNNKKVRVSVSVSVSSLPEPELGHALEFESPTSFNTLDDDCLGNVLDFVGKKCYSAFGRVNKRCHEMFCSKGLPKETYIYGYGPLRLIQQRGRYNLRKIAKAVLYYNRRDILEWILADESEDGHRKLKWLCYFAMKESRLDILREVFRRANGQQLEYLRDCDKGSDLCYTAVRYGKLEYLKFLRENECGWDKFTWRLAKEKGHDHILEYLQNNGYPTVWQVDSDSESEDYD